MKIKELILQNCGEICRECRKKNKLTMKECADMMGITESAISKIESGKVDNLVYYLFAISDFSWENTIRLLIARVKDVTNNE